jgi:transcriptional regulator with XRE-family HTH domain
LPYVQAAASTAGDDFMRGRKPSLGEPNSYCQSGFAHSPGSGGGNVGTMDQTRAVEVPVGERVRFFRETSKRTQVSVAARAGISVDHLYAIERGLRSPSMPVLFRLAAVLGQPVSALLSEPSFGGEDPRSPWGPALARALVDTGWAGPDTPDLEDLRGQLQALHRAYQETPKRYSVTAPFLPDLVRAITHATRLYRTPGDVERQRDAFRLGADLMLLVRPVAKYLNRPDLALMAGDRGVVYAQQADDPVRIAVCEWNLAQALSTHNEAEATEQVALEAAEALRPETTRDGTGQRDAMAIYGMLEMMAALAQVRQGDLPGAKVRIEREAAPIARRVGETNVYWTLFGPTNVAVWSVDVLTQAGNAAEALHEADRIDVAQLGSIERRATHLLTIGRAHEYRGDDASVLLTLMTLEREAPEDLQYRSGAHDLIRGLLHRMRPTFARDVRQLADRVGLYA